MIRYGVKVIPREVILDTQGRAVSQVLVQSGFPKVHQVRVGKWIEVELNLPEKEAHEEIQKIARGILINPLLENYEIVKL
ncbi:MAG: phosphoribosylformylglycinamidine synthase subunit PurS [Proteobacteria bacterium]|nr:phosphoribosylformylglycinamidine synthase subunit PurS [Pseudomonadota bacterium]